MTENKPSYGNLRRSVSSLEEQGLIGKDEGGDDLDNGQAVDVSQPSESAEANPERRKLTPELLKARAKELLNDKLQELKGTIKGAWDILSDQLVAGQKDILENSDKYPLLFALMIVLLSVTGGVMVGLTETQSSSEVLMGMTGGWLGALKISVEISKLLESKKGQQKV